MEFSTLFFECVAELLQEKSELVTLVKEGLFVSESAMDRELAEQVYKYILRHGDAYLDEVRLLLYKSLPWEWVYFLREKDCIPGLLLPIKELEDPFTRGLISEDVRIENAEKKVSHRDPFYVDNPTCRPLIHIDFAAELKVYDAWYKLSHRAFEQFAGLYTDLICVRGLRKANEAHTATSAARDRLRVFQKLFQKSELVWIVNKEFSQRMRYRGHYQYRRYREVIFVINKETLVIEDVILIANLVKEPTEAIPCIIPCMTLITLSSNLLEANKGPAKMVRITKGGLFVAYKWISKLIDQYQLIDPLASRQDIKKWLWQLTKGEITYLIDGDTCVFGIIIPSLPLVEAIGWHSLDHIVSGAQMLLADDPIFHEGGGIGLPIQPRCLARFKVGDEMYHISIHAFNRFIERAHANSRLRKLKGFDFVNRRGYLLLLYHLLSKSQLVSRNNAPLQYLRHEFRRASYRTYAGWLFVILEDNTVITLYDKGNPIKAGYRHIVDEDNT